MISDIDLINRVKTEGDSVAMTELIERHSGAYIKVVQKYVSIEKSSPYPSSKLNIDELRDDKTYYLHQFALKYDPARDTKFSTYVFQMTRYLCLDLLNETPEKVEITEFNAPTAARAAPNPIEDIKSCARDIDDPLFWRIFEMRHLKDKTATWRTIGTELGITHEWARQIYNQNIPYVRDYIST